MGACESVPSLHKYLETADTSDHDDGTTKHFHLNISAKRPQLMQNANVIDVPTTWHRFTGRTEPSEPAGDRPHDPSDMPTGSETWANDCVPEQLSNGSRSRSMMPTKRALPMRKPRREWEIPPSGSNYREHAESLRLKAEKSTIPPGDTQRCGAFGMRRPISANNGSRRPLMSKPISLIIMVEFVSPLADELPPVFGKVPNFSKGALSISPKVRAISLGRGLLRGTRFCFLLHISIPRFLKSTSYLFEISCRTSQGCPRQIIAFTLLTKNVLPWAPPSRCKHSWRCRRRFLRNKINSHSAFLVPLRLGMLRWTTFHDAVSLTFQPFCMVFLFLR